MQIVIDIPNSLYKIIQDCKVIEGDNEGNVENVLIKAVENGVVLPKGHGKLKDLDKIEWYGCDFEGRGCIETRGDCSVCDHANCYAKQVRELPTIIEADSESEE